MLEKSDNTDYYAFCDQDDVWDEDKLLIAINKLNEYDSRELNIYYCGQRLVDSNLNFISNHNIDEKRNGYSLLIKSNIAGCTAVFNKKLRDKINEKKPNNIIMHDNWILKVCVALGGNFIIDSKPHISYRQHGNNTIGLKSSFIDKIKQAFNYINTSKIREQIIELVNNYSDEIDCKYKDYCNLIINYNKRLKYKIKLLIYLHKK